MSGLSSPRIIFGIHSVTPYSRLDGTFYGTLRVLGGSSLSSSGAMVEVTGGSSKYAWAVEEGIITAEMTLKAKEYPDFLMQLFLGKAPTENNADTSGTIGTLTNVKGALMVATTGLASVTVIPTTGAANLKFGKYVVKAASATTVDVYCSTNIDFARGTAEDFIDDTLKVATAIAVADTGGTTDIAALGLRLTGGSGTVALTTGDTATFTVRPPSSKSMDLIVGANTDTFPEFGAIVLSKKRGNGEMFEIDVHRCKGVGLPFSFNENAFSENEVKIKCFYDSVLNKVFTIRATSPS